MSQPKPKATTVTLVFIDQRRKNIDIEDDVGAIIILDGNERRCFTFNDQWSLKERCPMFEEVKMIEVGSLDNDALIAKSKEVAAAWLKDPDKMNDEYQAVRSELRKAINAQIDEGSEYTRLLEALLAM